MAGILQAKKARYALDRGLFGSLISVGLGSERTSAPACLTDLLFKMGARVSYHSRRWYGHVAAAFPLAHHYRRCWPGVHRSIPSARIYEPREWYFLTLQI